MTRSSRTFEPLLDQTPTFSADWAVLAAQEIYDLKVSAGPLPSERDQNFLLHAASGEKLVLKVSNAGEGRDFLDAQQKAMIHVERLEPSLCPQVLSTRSGESFAEVE